MSINDDLKNEFKTGNTITEDRMGTLIDNCLSISDFNKFLYRIQPGDSHDVVVDLPKLVRAKAYYISNSSESANDEYKLNEFLIENANIVNITSPFNLYFEVHAHDANESHFEFLGSVPVENSNLSFSLSRTSATAIENFKDDQRDAHRDEIFDYLITSGNDVSAVSSWPYFSFEKGQVVYSVIDDVGGIAGQITVQDGLGEDDMHDGFTIEGAIDKIGEWQIPDEYCKSYERAIPVTDFVNVMSMFNLVFCAKSATYTTGGDSWSLVFGDSDNQASLEFDGNNITAKTVAQIADFEDAVETDVQIGQNGQIKNYFADTNFQEFIISRDLLLTNVVGDPAAWFTSNTNFELRRIISTKLIGKELYRKGII